MVGYSPGIQVSEDDFSGSKNAYGEVTGAEVDYAGEIVEVQPPLVDNTNASLALNMINPYPEFAFEKIQPPDYGADKDCIARFTGTPINNPDFLNDYYFISMMRLMDMIMEPEYNGKLTLLYDAAKPES